MGAKGKWWSSEMSWRNTTNSLGNGNAATQERYAFPARGCGNGRNGGGRVDEEGDRGRVDMGGAGTAGNDKRGKSQDNKEQPLVDQQP